MGAIQLLKRSIDYSVKNVALASNIKRNESLNVGVDKHESVMFRSGRRET